MNRLFDTAPISFEVWPHVIAVGLVAYSVVGFEKWVRFRVKHEK